MYLNEVNVSQIVEQVESFIMNSQHSLTIIVIVIAILISLFLQKLIYNVVIFFSTDKNRSKTNKLLKSYCNLIATFLKYVIYVIAFFIILGIYNVQITVMLTSAGFIGILITYIFADLIRDITNGFFIVFNAPFEIGDRVTIDGFTGKVKEIESRFVVIDDVNGNRCIISNRKIDSVIVLSRDINFKKR